MNDTKVYKYAALFLLCLIALSGFSPVTGQIATGGSFKLEQSVIATGGGQLSGGTFNLIGTTGQSAAGTISTGLTFGLHGGFWQPTFSPTAASVSISGRVSVFDGQGLRNATVTLIDQQGAIRQVYTSSFGYYRFENVAAGQTCVIEVTSRRFQFEPRFISVADDLAGVDFVGR